MEPSADVIVAAREQGVGHTGTRLQRDSRINQVINYTLARENELT